MIIKDKHGRDTLEIESRYLDRTDAPWRRRTLTGPVCEVVKKLIESGGYGCHETEFECGAKVQLSHACINFERFAAPERGTADARVWLRLDPRFEHRLVAGEAAQRAS